MQSLAFVKKIFVSFGKENIDKDYKIKNDDQARISKYENIFAKSYTPNWSEEVFVNKNVQNNVSQMYVIIDLTGEEIVEKFCEKKFKEKINQNLELKKVIKKKGDK